MMDLTAAASEAMKTQLFAGGIMLTLIGSAIAWGRQVPAQCIGFLRRRFIVQVDILGTDPLFRWLCAYLDELPSIKKSRLITASANDAVRRLDNIEPHNAGADAKPAVMFTPAPGRHLIWVNGRPIVLQRERKEVTGGSGRDYGGFQETFTLRAIGRSSAMLRNLLEEARDRAHVDGVRLVDVYALRYGDWRNLANIIPRPLASVFLPGDQLPRIVRDLEGFLSSEKWYVDRGIPWRRGHMYEGPPGNGKSSVVSALAGHLKLNLYICAISDKSMTDEKLLSAVQDMRPRSILLLEDVDAIVAGRTVGDGESGVTFAGLLNALDGVTSKPGVITIMTTNHPEKLDPALVRKGRVDLTEHFGTATAAQAEQIFRHFYQGRDDADAVAAVFGFHAAGKSMATIQGVLLDHKDGPAAAVGALVGAPDPTTPPVAAIAASYYPTGE